MQRRRSLMGMPAATRSVGHSQTHTHSHRHTLPRRILANLSQITVEHAHAPERSWRRGRRRSTHRTTGATSTAIFVILIVHCMCNMQHILPQLSAPLHLPRTCAPITQLFSCDPNRDGAIIAGHCRCPLPFLMLLTKFNWPLNDFNCATDVAHKLQRKLPATIAAVATQMRRKERDFQWQI